MAREFLETVDEATPTLHSTRHRFLEQWAKSEGWEPGQFFMEKDLLDWKFQNWIPIYATYSVVILLYSIVE
jgi:hypothetical protein